VRNQTEEMNLWGCLWGWFWVTKQRGMFAVMVLDAETKEMNL